MRGKVNMTKLFIRLFRITPAYAGKRINHGNLILLAEDHPRVCGEKTKKIP